MCKSGLRVLLVKFYGFRDKAFLVFRDFPGTLKGCKYGLNFFSKKTRHKKYQQNLKFFSLWYGAVWVGTEVCKSGLRVLLVKFYGFRDKAFFVFRGFPGTLKGCKSGLNFFFQKKLDIKNTK